MPVYASTSGFADHRRHPRALTLIIGGHAVLIAAVMTAKMEVIPPLVPTTTIVDFIDPPKPPPPEPKPKPEPETRVQPRNSQVDQPKTEFPIPNSESPKFAETPLPPIPDPGPIGRGVDTVPIPKLDPVLVGPRFATAERYIKPPYPTEKQRLEEEASLRLKLTIDPQGRVVAVEPVGKVDRTFFEAARKHLLAHWRYKPATEDGRPVGSSTVITLTFQLT